MYRMEFDNPFCICRAIEWFRSGRQLVRDVNTDISIPLTCMDDIASWQGHIGLIVRSVLGKDNISRFVLELWLPGRLNLVKDWMRLGVQGFS